MPVSPYLYFDGHCEEALEFYKKVFGAEITMLMRFKQSPDPTHVTPGTEEKVMHATFRIGETEIMASDGRCGNKASFQGFSLSVPQATIADSERVFAALAEEGQVQMPLTKTFYSPSFGMVADKFGMPWMIIVHAAM